MSTQRQYHYVSESGMKALNEQLESNKAECKMLRAKLVEMRQIKDVEEIDLVDDTLRLNFLEMEIDRVKDVIARSKLLTVVKKDGTVQIGSVVRLRPEDAPEGEMSCMLVSSFEANPDEGKISDESPLGLALLGKMKDAIVKVTGPRKSFLYRIVGVDSQR